MASGHARSRQCASSGAALDSQCINPADCEGHCGSRSALLLHALQGCKSSEIW